MGLKSENRSVEDFVLQLANKAQSESKVFPVDREFLNPYLNKIQGVNTQEFLCHNFKIESSLYVCRLFICLPELWQNITLDDLINISNSFTNVYSYFSLLEFTHKYIEIDIIEQILTADNVKSNMHFENSLFDYLDNQWNNLIKTEDDYEDFENGFIGVDLEEWLYIKQRFLIDERVRPAFTDYKSLQKLIKKIKFERMK